MEGCAVHIFVMCKEILSFSALVTAQHAPLQLTNANHASKADSEIVCLGGEVRCVPPIYEYPKKTLLNDNYIFPACLRGCGLSVNRALFLSSLMGGISLTKLTRSDNC